MNAPNQNTSLAVLKAESDEKFSNISHQIKDVSVLTRELIDQINDLKVGVGILTHSVKTIEADHTTQVTKYNSRNNTIQGLTHKFDDLSNKVEEMNTTISRIESYVPLLAEITEQRNQNIARATTLQNSFISSLGGSMGDVVKWVILVLLLALLSNAGAIMSAITGNNQEPKPEPNHESR